MKKLIYCALALAAGLFASSCQQENLEPVVQGNTVTYTVEVPSVATKAIGDATNINQLIYEVWRTGSPNDTALNSDESPAERLYYRTVKVEDRKATFEVDLVKDQNYTILFWAQVVDGDELSASSAYYVTTDLRNVTLKEGAVYGAFDEQRAAFYGTDFIVAGQQKAQKTVTLTRPFGQVNLGTVERDAHAMGYTLNVTATSVTVKGASTAFNVATGVASDETCADLTFASEAPFMPEGKVEKLNGTYEWIAMNYIFVPANQATLGVDYTITTNHGVISNTISNLPTQKNYRTNIVGNLLTSKTDYTVQFDMNWVAENTHGTNTEAVQAALDNALPGAIIQLHPGVNYGTLLIRPVEGQSNTITGCDYLVYRNEMLRNVEDLTIIGAPGATVDAIKVVSGYVENSGSTGYVVDIKNLVIDSVTFTDDYVNPPHSYSSPLFFDLSYINVDGLTVKNCQLIGDNAIVNFVYFYGSGNPANSTFVTAAKNITLENNTVDGIARLCELRQTENVTITNNTIRNTALHGMLLPVDGGTYRGNVTITENTADAINERFVRMAGAGDAAVRIENNTITNYLGKDADYIKVTDGTNVTIQNNSISYSTIPAEVNLVNGEIVTLPAAEADHTVVVKGEGTLVLNGTTITSAAGPAIEFAEDAIVTLQIDNEVNLTGVADGILVNGATLTVTGTGNLIVEGKAGSGIDGSVTIDGLANITSKGNGDHAYGIGGIGANVVIKNSTVDYACGGHIQPLFINDTKYGKSEPEGGAAIGGATVKIEGSTIEKVDGGSKAAAIGERFWQSTSIEIVNSTILEANGGNASAGIGGSRYGDEDKYNVSIKIQNSTVNAIGGQHGAGIGSGYDTHCNGQNYTAENKIEIDEKSVINAKGGKYAAGIGTGFHSAYLTGSIATGATVNAESGETSYKDTYTTAQNIGYGVVDPAREFSGENATITFTVAGEVIGTPYGIPVAMIGDTKYKSIDDAIANWKNNTTLTLLRDVKLSDVVTLNSNEHHILNLSTYTITAADKKNVFEITPSGAGTAARSCLTINADETNPGSIEAGNKACIYYKKTDGSNDRLMVTINGGIFNGTISSSSNNGGQACPYFVFNGGVFNKSINLTKAMLKVTGGIFHGMFSCTGDSTAHRLISGGTFKSWTFMTADAANKFTVGTDKQVYNVGVYVNDDGYLVVGGPVITEFGDKFAAKATNATKWSSYLQYSSAAANGLYYTNADAAIQKHGEANVVLK